MRTRPDPKQIAEIYIDESSQNNHRFLVLGAIVVAFTDAPELIKLLGDARLPELSNNGEMKWVKTSRTMLPVYKRFVDVFFDNPRLAHFHSLHVDTRKQNHSRWNDGSRDIGFNKEIYQIATKCARLYRASLFHLYPDRRNTPQPPEELRLILNRGRSKNGDGRDWPFRRCQFRDSKQSLPLQLADIFSGAIAFVLNGHAHAPNASPAKLELSEYILARAGVRDVFAGTAVAAPFSIWPRQLR